MLSTKMCTTPNRHATNSMDSISRTDTSSVCCHTHTHTHTHTRTHTYMQKDNRKGSLTNMFFFSSSSLSPAGKNGSLERGPFGKTRKSGASQTTAWYRMMKGRCLSRSTWYLLQASSCRLSNMVSGVGFLAFVVFYYIFLFDSYGFRGSSTLGKLPVTVSGNDTE